MSTVCGMRGAAGSGNDKQRKWVSMDECKRQRERKMDGGALSRKMSFWIITGGVFTTAGTKRMNV